MKTTRCIFFLYRGRHFIIEFKIEYSKFVIRDLGVGNGTFLRLFQPLELKSNQLINIGETFIVVNLIDKNEDFSNLSLAQGVNFNGQKASHIKLKVFGVNNNGETLYLYLI